MPLVENNCCSSPGGHATVEAGRRSTVLLGRKDTFLPGLYRDQVKIITPQLSWGKGGHYGKVRAVKCSEIFLNGG